MIRRGTLTIHRTRFLESEVEIRDEDGDVVDLVDIPHDDDHTTAEVWEAGELAAAEVVQLIRREGLTFEASGGAWAADPDGSSIINYGTGEREEVTAHLAGWPPRVVVAIHAAVDGAPVPGYEYDMTSSASRQHYIDTGRYLTREEVATDGRTI